MKEQKFLLFTLILLILVGGPAVYSVVNEPTIKLNLTATDSKIRQPASVKQEIPAQDNNRRNVIKAKSVTIEVGCDNREQAQETDGTLLRLKSDCWKSGDTGLSITNKSNGFTAAVIETQAHTFTTDYIDLQEGENRLEIKGINKQGQAIQKVMTVHRRLPASAVSENQ